MNLALAQTRARLGVHAPEVRVEAFLTGGLPAMTVVGLAETAVREARDRVRAAIQCAQFDFPAQRITINLAPADLPKDGGRFDLPIAAALLAASGQLPVASLRGNELLGELSLTGELRAVDSVLTAALACGREGRALIVPLANAAEASLARDCVVHGARTLGEVVAHLQGKAPLPRIAAPSGLGAGEPPPDLIDVRGQLQARRALEIAAAGGHHLLLCGSPGSGKTLLAQRLPGLLPPLAEDEALEQAALRGLAGLPFDPLRFAQRPFRAPHHSASAAALAGGGGQPRPGEISLAHHGVLFMDELPEWQRRALEILREPLESGHITLSRAARQAEFPARFQLVAAMNPCPCGWATDPCGRCRCPAERIARYRATVSGPLLDRIELHVNVPRVAPESLRQDTAPGESSAEVRTRVIAAQQRQRSRSGLLNAHVPVAELMRVAVLRSSEQTLLDQAMERLNLSARACHRLLRVARTIADLAARESIDGSHLAEALSYRPMDSYPARAT